MKNKIIMVFKTHFDIGFTDLSDYVIKQYAGDMLRQVISTCNSTKHMGKLKYVWTMPSWPLKIMQENSAPEDKKQLEILIQNGQIVWHALPFTSHFDFCGIEDYIHGFRYAKELSAQYKKPFPISAKMTDVPGHGAMLPAILSNAGVRFLHLGCNEFATPPDVPPLFFWVAPTGEKVLTMYSKGGYGSDILPPKDWPFPVWMALMHTQDNSGPQSAEMIQDLVQKASADCPDTDISCGSMDDFYHELEQYDLSHLPEVKGDLADTWIHGIGSYPKEVGEIRELRRKLRSLQITYACKVSTMQEEEKEQANRLIQSTYDSLILFGEHTWGLDVKTWLGKGRVYQKDEFLKALDTPTYQHMEVSWMEQRQRAEKASISCNELESLLFPAPHGDPSDIRNSEWTERSSDAFENNRYRIDYGTDTGIIHGVFDKKLNRYLLKEQNGISVFSYAYEKCGSEQIAEYLRSYAYRFSDWGILDNGREDYPECEQEYFDPIFQYSRQEETEDKIALVLSYRNEKSALAYGDAKEICIKVILPKFDLSSESASIANNRIDIEVILIGKQKTPFIESGVLRIPLAVKNPEYFINKNGCVLRPEKDIADLANHVYYSIEEFTAVREDALLCVVPMDTPLLSIGESGLYHYRKQYEEHAPILYFNLFNNMWGTNFPQWIGEDCTFRFTVFGEKKDQFTHMAEQAFLISEDSERSHTEILAAYILAHNILFPAHMRLSIMEPLDSGIVFRFRDMDGKKRTESFSYPGMQITPVSLIGNKIGNTEQDQISISVLPYGLHSFFVESECVKHK